MSAALHTDGERLAGICRKYHVRKLALFGSAARGDSRLDSDVDVLVEFHPDHRPGMVGLHEFEQELSALYEGRRIDLVNAKYLNPRIRERVLAEAEVQFAQRWLGLRGPYAGFGPGGPPPRRGQDPSPL